MLTFSDRADAGEQLAQRLASLRDEPNLLVLAIPRGGVVVGYAVALALSAQLDVALSRKLGAPQNPELAIGALAENGSRILDDELIRHLRVPADYIERVTELQRLEIERQGVLYRGARPAPIVRDRVVLVVDDGVATGATMIVTLQALIEDGARRLIAAAPVIAGEAINRLRAFADQVVCVDAPPFFASVGSFYERFDQVSDAEVRELVADLAATRS